MEEIFIVSQKCSSGFHKLCKSQERWWYSAKEAQDWLDKQEDYMRVCNAVFRLVIDISEVEMVYDLHTADPVKYEELKNKL